MYSLLFLALAALGVSLALTPLVRNLFLRAGLVDHPDQHRKTHARPIPRVGGISIAVAYAAAFLLLMATPLSGGALLADHLPLVWKLLPAAGLVFATGLVDDLAGLRPRQKLAGLAAAAIAAWWAGARITAIAGVGLGDAPSLALTLAWLVGCANAFNLIDGVDGLAAGIGLFATLTSLVAALLHGNWALALATAPLAGALLGFLRYNFNPASIFLGDCGSLLIGFLLGCYGVLWSQKSATLLGMTAPLMVMAIPIADVLLSIARRFLSHQPIFGADRGHIHHRLLDRGLTPKVVALTLYAVCGLGAVFSLLASVSGNRYPGLLLILFSGAVWMGVRHLGYVEFAVARRVFLGGPLRRLLGEQIRLQRLEQAIHNAVTPTDCWLAIREAATGFGFDKVHARIAGEWFGGAPAGDETSRFWTVRIPVSASDFVNCSRPLDSPKPTAGLASFAETLAGAVRNRLPALHSSTSLDPSLAALASAVRAPRHAEAHATEART